MGFVRLNCKIKLKSIDKKMRLYEEVKFYCNWDMCFMMTFEGNPQLKDKNRLYCQNCEAHLLNLIVAVKLQRYGYIPLYI